MDRVKDKVAVITGAARGLGKADVLTLAREGADIAIWDVNMEGAEQTAREVRELGRKAIVMKVDVTNSTEVNEAAQEVLKEFGKIDILVNNAGVAGVAPTLCSSYWGILLHPSSHKAYDR
jgi:NAD(P)-dependent dehydrogenase (short-subunit alcohol dehydrogenase family)